MNTTRSPFGRWLFVVPFLVCGLTACTVVDVKTVPTPVEQNCGGIDWKVAFTLKDPSSKGGWIIQEILLDQNADSCNSAPMARIHAHYWEAWQVLADSNHPNTRDQLHINYDDEYRLPDHPSSSGNTEAKGTIKFFSGVTLPANFVQRNPNTFAGILHSDTVPPPFWSTVSKEDAHEYENKWDCCVNPHTRSSSSTPPLAGIIPPSAMRDTATSKVGLLIETVPPWTSHCGDAQAVQLRSAARQIQKFAPAEIREGIQDFLNVHREDDDYLASLSKVYVLLRAVFNVPQEISREEAKTFGGWVHPSVLQKSGSYDLMWPLGLNEKSEVIFVGQFEGYFGSEYDAMGEFDYFSSKYKFRELQ
jgi:hypothetical protein